MFEIMILKYTVPKESASDFLKLNCRTMALKVQSLLYWQLMNSQLHIKSRVACYYTARQTMAYSTPVLTK